MNNDDNTYNTNILEDYEINCTDAELRFCIFIINKLSQTYNKPVDVVYRILSESGVLDEYIIGCYEALHTLGTEYLIDDITGLLIDRGFSFCFNEDISIPEPTVLDDLTYAKTQRQQGYKGRPINDVISNMEQIVEDVENENRSYNKETLMAFHEAEQIIAEYANGTRKPNTWNVNKEKMYE